MIKDSLKTILIYRLSHQYIVTSPMKQIFINLPSSDLNVAMTFYLQIGFTINALFTFENQKCMVWSDQIYVMLQNQEMFRKGNKKTLADPKEHTTASFTLPVNSIEKLNQIIENGIKAGGRESTPKVEEEFMVVRNLEDPDGHVWGIICLDIDKFKAIKEN